MGLATEPPIRLDVSFFGNDDRAIGARWLQRDAVTPVPVESAQLTLLFDPPETEWIDGEPQPLPDPVRYTIDSTATDDPAGWIDAALFAEGTVLATVPHTIWPNIDSTTNTGIWDLVAVAESGPQRCLLRGEFSLEAGP